MSEAWAVNKINDLVEKNAELEMALCHANSKLFKVESICEQIIIDSEEAIKEVTDGSEDIYKGHVEVAEQILDYLNGESG